MALNRKDFLRKACLSGACLCGFSSIAFSKALKDNTNAPLQEDDKNSALRQEWIANILQNFNLELDKESIRKVIKKTSIVHYKNLKMDDLLAEYQGNIDKFIVFLRDSWGWKIDYDKVNNILIADENKNYCVCPIANSLNKEIDSSAICYCSEGFAEKMFSKISGKEAKAEVVSSIRKGDQSCKYKVVFSNT